MTTDSSNNQTISSKNTLSSKSIIKVGPFTPHIEFIGLQQTPVIIIDDFGADLSPLIDIAIDDSQFNQDQGSYYPGQRAPLPKQYVIDVINAVYQLIYDTYKVPHSLRLKPQQCVFSVIDKPAQRLLPLQCMPHFDTPEPHYFAILHYLNNGDHGDTGFFRHNTTQYEQITPHNIDHYFSQAQPVVDAQQTLTPDYVVDSNDHYTLYHQVQYRPNRLVIYPGNLLHSTLVNSATDIDSSPKTGRLTANIFINFK
jgi:hypothetical protein